MKKFTKLIAVSLFVALNVTGVLPGANTTKQAQASDYIGTGSAAQSYITLGSYYISQKNVKEMAKNMRAATGGGAIITSGVVGYVLARVPGMAVITTAAALSANAQSQTEVLYAADHNMRVQVVIKDQAAYHTSYSTVVEFTAVH
ncbi:MAG TPA: hypothetical protein VIM51_13600 [Desulfosporosinus sp.]